MKLNVESDKIVASTDEITQFRIVDDPKEYLRIVPKGNTLDVVVSDGVTLTEAAREFIATVGKMLTMTIGEVNNTPSGYNTTLFCAFRYALGRSTHVVDSIVQAIHAYWNHLTESDKSLFVREITEHHEKFGKIGMEMDTKLWFTIVDRYNSELVSYTGKL